MKYSDEQIEEAARILADRHPDLLGHWKVVYVQRIKDHLESDIEDALQQAVERKP